jgi:hypothetical protein
LVYQSGLFSYLSYLALQESGPNLSPQLLEVSNPPIHTSPLALMLCLPVLVLSPSPLLAPLSPIEYVRGGEGVPVTSLCLPSTNCPIPLGHHSLGFGMDKCGESY